jgi:hypothetical protein
MAVDLSEAQANWQRHCAERFAIATQDFETQLKANLPVVTGHLRDTTTVTVTGAGANILVATADLAAPYAIFLDKGTRPHVILPRNAKVLVFQGSGGGTVFASKVNHPGFPSQEIFERPAPILWQIALENAFR